MKQIEDTLWQVAGEQPALSDAREAGAVLDDLMKASATVVIKLKRGEGA